MSDSQCETWTAWVCAVEKANFNEDFNVSRIFQMQKVTALINAV